jgi:hypothetical protein
VTGNLAFAVTVMVTLVAVDLAGLRMLRRSAWRTIPTRAAHATAQAGPPTMSPQRTRGLTGTHP